MAGSLTATEDVYDFIIVGGGNSGAVVASRLAASLQQPSVLLLEAGGLNDGLENMSGQERYGVAFKEGSSVNWSYKTSQQYGDVIDYSRGKGLGGSTAINFCGWLVGPRDDFDEWARIVDDRDFSWENARRCLKRVECLHNDVPEEFRDYINPNSDDHGDSGAVALSYQSDWHESVRTIFEAGKERGWNVNPDVNSGDPIGLGVGPNCIHQDVRVTAASAYLGSRPRNLTICHNSHVSKVTIQDGIATGVEVVGGRRYSAAKEVILSGGAINSPQILQLSGIGPEKHLQQHGIEVQRHLPAVGQNLRDHCFSTAGIVIHSENAAPESQQNPSPMGWFKNEHVSQSREFDSLSGAVKAYLQKPTVPLWEIATHAPFLDDPNLPDGQDVLAAIALIMCPQSTGEVSLRSANPLDHPVIDPRFLTHPFDQRVAIEAMRELLEFFKAPALAKKTVRRTGWPEDTSDAGLLQHFRSNLRSSWHMCGTVAMGMNGTDSCVDSSFRVHGVDCLRVVDMSVVPIIPNTHTQSTAYLLAEIAAEKIIACHCLRGSQHVFERVAQQLCAGVGYNFHSNLSFR